MQRQGTHVQFAVTYPALENVTWFSGQKSSMRNHTIFSTRTNMQLPQPHNHQKTLTPDIL
ncbi:hypothetical protein BDZ91DRAFT_733696 [Kalaharituber pfeilii]|nr:hypothetical protein BDZ91DRAFT_733696 [Kalaharituber pfeilii]